MLAAVVCGALLVLRGPDRVFGGALALLIGASIAWILVSVLWPARPDRTCPACGESSLRRMDAGTTRGVVCSACGHRDEAQSSFLMAEEEGATIERIRLEARSPAPRSSAARSPAARSEETGVHS
jgi:ribosomal protein L37AE/L43A